MPWLAVPHERRDIKEELVKRFEFKTIPQLIFVNEEMKVIVKNGRKLIADNLDNKAFIYEALELSKY
jgi:hypothetical protein